MLCQDQVAEAGIPEGKGGQLLVWCISKDLLLLQRALQELETMVSGVNPEEDVVEEEVQLEQDGDR